MFYILRKRFTNNKIKWIYIVLNAQSLQTKLIILKWNVKLTEKLSFIFIILALTLKSLKTLIKKN